MLEKCTVIAPGWQWPILPSLSSEFLDPLPFLGLVPFGLRYQARPPVAEIRKFNFYLQNFIATWRSDSIYYLQKLILVLLNTLQSDFKELGEDEWCWHADLKNGESGLEFRSSTIPLIQYSTCSINLNCNRGPRMIMATIILEQQSRNFKDRHTDCGDKQWNVWNEGHFARHRILIQSLASQCLFLAL